MSSTVCPKIGLFLADVSVQIGFGASSGMLAAKTNPDSKSDTIVSVLDAAFIGAASGLVSGLLGRVALIRWPEAEEGTMKKILFRVGNTILTFGFVCLGQLIVATLYHSGTRESIHA